MIRPRTGNSGHEAGQPDGARAASPVVFVVDDDDSVRLALVRLMRAAGYEARGFASADAFLDSKPGVGPCCLILDLRLPGMDGLELQTLLHSRGIRFPTIFMSGLGDIPSSVQALKSGALTFLEKPYDENELLEVVRQALSEEQIRLEKERADEGLLLKWSSLTKREQEVMALVVQGLLNKQIAWQLGIAEKTVKVHRARVIAKMGVSSLPDLVRISMRLKLAQGRKE